MSRGAGRIDEERVCIDSLVQFLKGIDGNSSVVPMEEPDDPPDYWLTIGEQRFAVEVTSIVTDQGYVARCQLLKDSIKEQYESDLAAVGTYALRVIRRPNIPRRGSEEWGILVEDALANIKELTGSPVGLKVRLIQDKSGNLEISKLSGQGCTVGMVQTPEAKWGVEVQEELTQLLEQAIQKKHEKIRKKGVIEVCADVILLLYDAYGYGNIGDAARALSKLNGYDWLHSIFWAASFSDRGNTMYPDSPGRSGRFLFSKNDHWCR